MPTTYVPPEHSLVRYVPFTRLRRDDNDNVLGVLAEAFVLRPDEEYLSATWLEYFDGERQAQIVAAVQTIRSSRLAVKPRSGFAIGNVHGIAAGCGKCGCKIRVCHEPEDDNQAHTAVRRWPRENRDLFELMADEAWCEVILNRDIA